MSTNTAALLAMSPQEAVVAMFNDAYQQAMPIRWGRASLPVDNGDGTITVTLSVRPARSPDETLTFTGTKALTYPRGDLTAFFGGLVDDFIPTLPTTTQTLADLIAARFGIVNDANDFIIAAIDSGAAPPYTLNANPKSLRWSGSLTFNATGTPE
jgi:hypothetical protein